MSNLYRSASAVILGVILCCTTPRLRAEPFSSAGEFKIGWIGALSGANAKYGAFQAALLAQDDINAEGGILGKKLVTTPCGRKGRGVFG